MARPKGPRGGQMDAAAELWHMSIRDLTTKNSQARYNGAIDTQIYKFQEKMLCMLLYALVLPHFYSF